MSKILIIRFSALGDVAMTIPVIFSLAKSYPIHEIIVLSRKTFEPLFQEMPSNVLFKGVDLKVDYSGFKGIQKLYRELKSESFDFVADFHSVLRSNYLRFRLHLNGVPTAQIDKGRYEKKKLTQKKDKNLIQLINGFERYQDVLSKLGFNFEIQFTSLFGDVNANFNEIVALIGAVKEQKWIGIAPFAKHIGKVYPLELEEKVISYFAKDNRVKVFVFGGGEKEKAIIDSWVKKHPEIISLVGKLNMSQELVLMNYLDVMFSMDSANMHLASLVNTPVVSLWGATHPYAGFMGWNQSIGNAIQTDLSCRPCSVYGQIPCYRKDYACLNRIEPETIINRIENLIY